MLKSLNLTEQEIRSYLAQDEGQYLERKSLWEGPSEAKRVRRRESVREDIAECLGALANADGGLLILGAEDDGTPTGHGYPEEAIQGFMQVPDSRLKRPVKAAMQRAHVDGHELVLLQVRSAPEAVQANRGFPYRNGDSTVWLSQDEINAIKKRHQVVSFEADLRTEPAIADLDIQLLEEVKGKTPCRDLTNEDFLVAYNLAERRNLHLVFRNAALLLFGRPPLGRWHPRAGLRVFHVKGTERLYGANRNVVDKRFDLPLLALIPAVHAYIKDRIRKSEKLHDLFFREMPEYPDFAWQEAVVNAVSHRDYQITSREIECWLYDDRMEVRSPGNLIEPLTVEKLERRRSLHASRNPLMVRVLVDYGLMREEGEGIPRMFAEMESYYLHPPRLTEEDDWFVVRLENTPIFDVGSSEWIAIIQSLPLNHRQKRVLAASGRAGFTNGDYQRLNSVDRDTAYREIREIELKGFVIPSQKHGKGAKYYVVLPERMDINLFVRRFPFLRKHFEVEETISNAQYRAHFELRRYEAVRELQRLVAEGYLRSEGKGRGACYRPGPRLFPER